MKRSCVISASIPLDFEIIELLFDQMSDVVFFLKDAEGRYVSVNSAFVERHGLKSKSQVLGKRPLDLSGGDLGIRPTQQDVLVLATGRPLLNHLQMQWRSPQEPGWCLTTKLPIRDSLGAIVGLIGVSRDVKSPIKREEIPVAMAAALNHFEGHLTEHVTPSTLAGASKMSLSRFSRLLRRVYGVTPLQRICQIRCASAEHLLIHTTRTMSEIGQACGFYDQSSFTRIFRKMTGLAPSRYREMATDHSMRNSVHRADFDNLVKIFAKK